VIVNSESVNVAGHHSQTAVEIQQHILAVINKSFISTGAGRALNTPIKGIVFVTDCQTTRERHLLQPVFTVPTTRPRSSSVSFREHISIVVVRVGRRRGAGKSIERLIAVARAQMRRGAVADCVIPITLIATHLQDGCQPIRIVIVEAPIAARTQPTTDVVRIVVGVLMDSERRRRFRVR